ncbi:MAG: Ig-like domain-containing protein [Eubacterium sp.]|nr:Ig-like domain-containing protein [Eubacterium sp.]
MKFRKLTSISLAVMMLACAPGESVLAANDTTEPVFAEAGEHKTVGNVTVENADYAVSVVVNGSNNENKDASVIVDGNVNYKMLQGGWNNYAVSSTASSGNASVEVKGDVLAEAASYLAAIYAENSTIKVGGSVSVKGNESSASAIDLCGGNIQVGGNVKAEGKYADGINTYAYSPENPQTLITKIVGGIDVQGENSSGLRVGSGLHQVSVGKGITSMSNGTAEYDSAEGITVNSIWGTSTIDVTGDVTVKSTNKNATGIQLSQLTEGDSMDEPAKSTIKIHGNLNADGDGIQTNMYMNDKKADILVEKELNAKGTAVICKDMPVMVLGDRVPLQEEVNAPKYNVNLTVWKASLNEKGNVAEVEKGEFGYIGDVVRKGKLGISRETVERTAAKDFEANNINYIIKTEQPTQGGKISVVTEKGKALEKSFGYEVAKEGEKIVLKANLNSGWKIANAYNGKEKLPKDANGNYYLVVPKGGGVSLSVDLKQGQKKASTKKSVSGVALAKMVAKGDDGLVLSWSKVKGVKGYDIFFNNCGKTTKCKKVKTVKANKKLQWTKTGLEKNTAYKAIVRAYVIKNGKKKYVRTSPEVHAFTSGTYKSYTNVSSVSVNKKKVVLKKGKSTTVSATIEKVDSSKEIMPKQHAAKLRYLVSNKKVVSVSKKGTIKAKAKGSCNVYVFAHNGISAKIKVRVQ